MNKVIIKYMFLNKKNYWMFAKFAITICALSALISYGMYASYSISLTSLLLSAGVVFLLRREQGNIAWWKAFVWGLSAFLLRGSIVWALKVFPLEDHDLVILTLQMPLDGFVMPFILEYLLNVFIVGLFLIFLSLPFLKRCLKKLSFKGSIAFFMFLMLWNILSIYLEVPLQQYWNFIRGTSSNLVLSESEFWEKNYVNADSLNVEMVETPRNLILIIMESMENWPDSITPELKQMYDKNISFSSTDSFGGGIDVAGSRNTYCATLSKTTGVPMLRESRYRSKTDLMRVKSIYDVLHRFGYKNAFLQGTDANFAGFNRFLQNHGIDYLFDMNSLEKEWDMDSFLRNFRTFSAGITDKRLYEISKSILDTISKGPFSLTLATIETHYPYGFYNSQCLEKPENISEKAKFKATLKCASREVYEYVEWIKKQKFYKNTEIVVVGDHLFMGDYFVKGRDREWVTIFINPQRNPKTLKRKFVSLDIAPSILESMGFQIEGHKMGLGTSLYSDSMTLLEKMGRMKLNEELTDLSRSVEYNQLHRPWN
ncbi:MAG: sulfatase-like hydrolase/transferase [Fibrobacter sp.]|nr:sulfatase-like hydrolase/transferase [Fibrobacter sp.]